jgi:hypothetical protein
MPCFVSGRQRTGPAGRLLRAGCGFLAVCRHVMGLCDLLNHLEVLGDYSRALLRGLFDIRILRRLGCVFEVLQVLFMVFQHGLDVGFVKLRPGERFEFRDKFLIFFLKGPSALLLQAAVRWASSDRQVGCGPAPFFAQIV